MPLQPASLIFAVSFATFAALILILNLSLQIDSYISFTAAFTCSMVAFYIMNKKSVMKNASYRFTGDFLLFATAGYLFTVLITGVLRQINGSIFPWSVVTVAAVIMFGILVYPR
ncbi:MAG: hypothetical protein ACLFVQ_04720 [Chitinispirillaceae bacterium]